MEEAEKKERIAFNMSEKSLNRAIEAYKKGVEDGSVPLPCPSDWYIFIGYDVGQMRDLYSQRWVRRSAYRNRAIEAKKMLDWCRNQVVIHPNWRDKSMTSRAIFTLKQDYGDGEKWTDKEEKKAAAPSSVNVVFGTGKGKNAAK